MDHDHPKPGSIAPAADEIATLLLSAAGGDEQSWRRIIDLYSRRVFAMAQSHLRNADLAEEITQSVFVTLAQKLPESTSGGYTERGRFEPWLFRITMNRVRDEARRRKRQAVPTDPDGLASSLQAAPEPSHQHEPDAEIAHLRVALDALADSDREIIELRHIGGMSFKQIAATLDAPLGTVLARHHRALKKLRNTLESKSLGQQTEP
ncbi:MAG: RNA polymerase sigma factor [Phycisphaerales bacterium]